MWPFKKRHRPPQHSRAFAGARTGRLYDEWRTESQSINHEILRDGRRLIKRARDLAKNHDYTARFLGLAATNVLGSTGLRLRSRVPSGKAPGQGIDKGAATAIETAWAAWSRRCDVTGRNRRADVERLFLLCLLRDGEAMLRHRATGPHAYSVQLIDPLLLDFELNRSKTHGDTEIVMGVEMDDDRMPLAYWFLADVKSPNEGIVQDSRNYNRVPADEIEHAFIINEVGQARGYSSLAPVMMRAHHLAAYEESVIVNARGSANTMGFFTRSESGEGYTGEGENADGDLQIESEPGSFHTLPAGVGLEVYKPEQPQQVYEEFVRSSLRGIAAGFNISYYSLANDLKEVNFATGRIGRNEDMEVWKGLQSFLVDYFERPVFEAWLDAQLTRGSLRVNNRPLRIADRERYQVADFVGRRWAGTEPLKEIQAHREGWELRTRTLSSIIREAGEDPETVFREWAEEKAKLEELNISISEAADITAPQVADDGDDDDDDKD